MTGHRHPLAHPPIPSRKAKRRIMMLIDCPECGPRNEDEFHYGGQAHVPYPADGGASLSDEEWAGYLFYRANPQGPLAERWMHSGGCRRWFNAVRDTRTNAFLAVYRVTDPPPDLDGHHRHGLPTHRTHHMAHNGSGAQQ